MGPLLDGKTVDDGHGMKLFNKSLLVIMLLE